MREAAAVLAAAEMEVEEEEFYESLDRILSSSCSSTSASDDDADHRSSHHRWSSRHHLPSFPVASSYDVWIAEPSSVAERRRRLLQQMGLAGDRAFSRFKSNACERDVAGPRATELSLSGGHSRWFKPSPAITPIVRSGSDSSLDSDRVNKERLQRWAISFGSAGVRNEPSVAGMGEGNYNSFSLGTPNDGRCAIGNLDEGSEFVVKEILDGTWNKMKELSSGRQLNTEEFEMCVCRSPIVRELMLPQKGEETSSKSSGRRDDSGLKRATAAAGMKSKRKGNWLKSIRNLACTVVTVGHHHHRDRRSSDEKETLSEKGGRRSSSATDNSLDGSYSLHHGPERIKVRQFGKSFKELSGLYITREIQAHNGAIWSIKFSSDARHLASAGEDWVIHVWEVVELERNRELSAKGAVEQNGKCHSFLAAINSGSPELTVPFGCVEGSHWEKKRRPGVPNSRRSVSSDHLMLPEHIFVLSDKPICSFRGHTADVLDLSWSKSQYLLSSSMDTTVKLWHMSGSSCLKTFSHSDYVTCIQFNPVDDRYFISGSLDEKVRLWSVPDRRIVDWNDIHESVTAVCFTPDGKGALVGTHKGSCHFFGTSENKLQLKCHIGLQAKKKKSNQKKISGFQFVQGSYSEVLITSADSRIRVFNGAELVHKFKGFLNRSSQISASLSANGKYLICASEDSNVYVWRYDADSQPARTKGVVTGTQAYEHFHCQDVTVAVAWPGPSPASSFTGHRDKRNGLAQAAEAKAERLTETKGHESPYSPVSGYIKNSGALDTNSNEFADRASNWPEEKLLISDLSPQSSGELSSNALQMQSKSAWGLAIVTAGHGGKIKTYQNFGFPFRV